MAPRIAIVGAGWSGLAAAVELADSGSAITLFESARQTGGRARALMIDGERLDNGQHLLSGAYRETLALLARVGVDAGSALLRLRLEVLVPGRFHLRLPRLPAPLHLVLGLFAARGPALADKLAAARFIRAVQAAGFRLVGDRTVSRWLDEHGQHGALRHHLWEPLCLAALNTAPEHASAQVFANVLRDTLGGARPATDLLLPRRDLGALLPEPAVRHLRRHGGEIRQPARIRAITPNQRGFTLAGDGFAERFDQVILACAPQHAAALVPALPELAETKAAVSGFGYEPIATTYVRYPPSVRLPRPLLALDQPPAQWVFDRGQLGNRAGLLAHVLSAAGPWQDLDNAALAAALHAALARALPGLPAPLAAQVVRERRATFACRPDLARPPNATPMPGFWLAGDYTAGDYPATLEGAVRSGLAAARGVIAATQAAAS